MITQSDLKLAARAAGLDLIAAVPANIDLNDAIARYQAWLQAGYAGDMAYLLRPDAISKRADPHLIMPEAKTVVIGAASYLQLRDNIGMPDLHGSVSIYAWGEDYHRWLLERMRQLIQCLQSNSVMPVNARISVDTGPVMERAWAMLGGLGWIGKNACLISPRFGSWIFLAVALVDAEIEPTHRETEVPGCGTCTRCLDACPTGALVKPGLVDARRCLSYLTIEHRGAIPVTYRQAMGITVFGCDVCQQVCPWNARAMTGLSAPAIQWSSLALTDALFFSEDAFHERFRTSPIWRAKAEGLARNAAVVLGNVKDRRAISHLERAVAEHPSPLVAEHAQWALTQIE